jgi:LPS export ABC transporter protein LptC
MNVRKNRRELRSTLSKHTKKFHAPFGIFQMKDKFPAIFILLIMASLSCSFDYGSSASDIEDVPDITMEGVEYVRVRNGNPQAKFTAEHVSRYEDKQTMELKNLSFEQFENRGEEVNAEGKAGSASVELESGNIRMDGGVQIIVESEDYIIETGSLEWSDKDRILSSGADEVSIRRNDGTSFSGHGFSADVRNRTWSFSAGVSGIYVHEDEEEDEGEAAPPDSPPPESEALPLSELEEGDMPTDIDSEIQEKEEDAE